MAEETSGFLSRWARRKARAQAGDAVAPEPPVAPVPVEPLTSAAPVADAPDAPVPLVDAAPAAEPAPTLADVALLGRASDYSRFVATGVDEGVKRAAMKKLFSDPHFNVMDGLDTYIDDYGKPDPIPLAMLRRLNQSKVLRLFDDEEEDDPNHPQPPNPPTATAAATAAESEPEPTKPSDDDPDLRLQQDDAAGRPGPDQGAGA
jgi:hypothetical protein